MGNKDRESLTQLSHRFRKTVNEEVEGNTLSKNSRWWDSYQSILKSEVKNRRNLSVESKPQSIWFKFQDENNKGFPLIESNETLKKFEWAKANFDFAKEQLQETIQNLVTDSNQGPVDGNSEIIECQWKQNPSLVNRGKFCPKWNKKLSKELKLRNIKETQESIEFLKTLQTIGVANIWKEFHYPDSMEDVCR